VLSRIASKDLTAFVIWVPQLAGTYADAIQASRLIDDPRTRHYWDQTDVTGTEFARVLGVPGFAWDVYLAYAAGIRWSAELPPRPTYWMQQLGLRDVPRLNGSVFSEHIKALLHQS
jgi:hypothetical protein